jgi:hypothetical protein
MTDPIADFHAPLLLEGYQVLFPARSGDPFILLPQELQVVERSADALEFEIELVRSAMPTQASFGRLSFQLRPRYMFEQVLASLRELYPGARLGPAFFRGGYLRFLPADSLTELPLELSEPIPLGWNGLDTARFFSQLSQDSAEWVLAALQQEVLSVRALAEVEIEGLAPRVPVVVNFDPAQLIAHLQMEQQGGLLRRAQLDRIFAGPINSLPLVVKPELAPEQIGDFAAAMADRVYIHLGVFTPSPPDVNEPTLSLAQVMPGRFTWDLAERSPIRRPLALGLNPLQAAHELVARRGIAALVTRSSIPPLSSSMRQLELVVRPPDNCLNVLRYGVVVRTEPNLPRRAGETRQVEFRGAEAQPPLELRFLPSESLRYYVSSYVLLQTSQGVRRYDSPERAGSDRTIRLYSQDFPVRFLVVAASQELLALATVEVSYQIGEGDAQRFTLIRDSPLATVALPDDGTSEPGFSCVAVANESGARLALRPLHAPLRLELSSFPQYGVQHAAVMCQFDAGVEFAAFEFQAEDEVASQLLAFTPTTPVRRFSFFPKTIFAARYRYRPRGGTWSNLRSADELLQLTASPQLTIKG